MVKVESIQCPKCGSPLRLEAAGKEATCDYCGARLRITVGTSGYPLAVLDDIRVDTALMARETVLRRLERNLEGLQRERDALVTAQEQPRRLGWRGAAVRLLLIIALAALAVPAFKLIARLGARLGLLVVLVAIALVLLAYLCFERGDRRPESTGTRVRNQRERRLAEMSEEIARTTERI